MSHPNSAPNGTQSIQRASLLLRVIASHNRLGLRVVDICKLTLLQRPTVHRMLQCLVAENLVTRHPKTRNFHLGQVVYELGLTASPAFRLRELCEAHLLRLATSTEDIVFLTVRSDFDGVCIDRKEGRYPIRSFTVVGTRRPLGVGAGGLAVLSALPDGEIGKIVSVNAPRLEPFDYTPDSLQQSVQDTRKRGHSVHDGASGSRAIGMPISNSSGRPIAAISITAPKNQMQPPRCRKLTRLMRSEIDEIEHFLRSSHV